MHLVIRATSFDTFFQIATFLTHSYQRATSLDTFLREQYISWYISTCELHLLIHFFLKTTALDTFLTKSYIFWYIPTWELHLLIHSSLRANVHLLIHSFLGSTIHLFINFYLRAESLDTSSSSKCSLFSSIFWSRCLLVKKEMHAFY